MSVHHLEFLSLKEAAQARLSLFKSKYHIVGNHTLRLIYEPAHKVLLTIFLSTVDSKIFANSIK